MTQRSRRPRPLRGVAPLVLGLVLGGVAAAGAQPAAANETVVIVGGTLIDGTGGPVRPNVDIVVSGNRITRIVPSRSTPPPAGARVIDAAGRYVIPGLWDAHAHYRDYYPELYVTHGITSVVDWAAGAPLEWILAQKEGAAKGKIYGPRIYSSGEVIRADADPEAARQRVRELKARGVDKIDFPLAIKRESLLAAIDEAQKVGLPTSGFPVYAKSAIDAGITALKHGFMLGAANAELTDPARFRQLEHQAMTMVRSAPERDARLFLLGEDHDALVKLMLARKVAFVVTFKDWKTIHDRRDEYQAENFRLLANPELQYLPAEDYLYQLSNEFEPGIGDVATGFHGSVDPGSEQWKAYRRGYENIQSFIRKFVKGGGHVLAGIEPHSMILPGIALHQELQLLVDAGMTPMQALQASTSWAAEYVRMDKDLGTVAEGKLADMLILKANPLDDIRNTRRIETVIQNGRVQPTGYHRSYVNPIPLLNLRAANSQGHPRPQVDVVLPGAVHEGDAGQTLTVRGRSFVPVSTVYFERIPLETTYVSPTELRAVLPERLTRTAGSYLVRAFTPRPRGGESEPLPLIVKFK